MNTPGAWVVHELPGRVRLRIPEKRGNEAYFSRLTQDLEDWGELVRVKYNSYSASVLIEYKGDFVPIAEKASDAGLFVTWEASTFEGLDPRTPSDQFWQFLKRMDTRIEDFTRGKEDLSSLAFFLLVGLGIYQVVRGSALPAATTLFTEAVKIVAASHLKSQHEAAF
jgi:hypothetical protein